MVLCLEVLRVHLRTRPDLYGAPDRVGLEVSAGRTLDDAYGVLSRAAPHAPFARTMRDAVLSAFRAEPHIDSRLLRARLALLLRALLRADAGDVYGVKCEACAYNGRRERMVAVAWRRVADVEGRMLTQLYCRRCGDFEWTPTLRITPLWELAHLTPRQRREGT